MDLPAWGFHGVSLCGYFMRRDKQDKQVLSWELFEGATLQVAGSTGVINEINKLIKKHTFGGK